MPEYPKLINKVIKYPSPSGKVSVGKYIPPFEKVENGFGFEGVLVEDIKTKQLQCHSCGGWFENLSTHVSSKHNLSANDYKLKYGLSISTALRNERMRLISSKTMIELRKKNKSNRFRFGKNNTFAGNRKGKRKSKETLNKYGVCDLQLAEKVLSLKNKLGKTPTLIDLKNEYGGQIMFHIHKRYRSYISFCKQLELEPNNSNFNPKYSRKYFLEKVKQKEPSLRLLTRNEARALYRYFKSVKDWKNQSTRLMKSI